MGAAFRVVTVQRGLDPRGFAVVASGGAGPMHAARVAERFEISTVIVPPSCGVGSAVGLLGTDLSTDRVQTRVQHESSLDWDALDAIYRSLAASRCERPRCRPRRADDRGEPVRGRSPRRTGSRADGRRAGRCLVIGHPGGHSRGVRRTVQADLRNRRDWCARAGQLPRSGDQGRAKGAAGTSTLGHRHPGTRWAPGRCGSPSPATSGRPRCTTGTPCTRWAARCRDRSSSSTTNRRSSCHPAGGRRWITRSTWC